MLKYNITDNRSEIIKKKYASQYTFLNSSQKQKDNALKNFSKFLLPAPKLPKIKTDKSENSKRIQKDLYQIKELLRKKQENKRFPLSQQRLKFMPMMIPNNPITLHLHTNPRYPATQPQYMNIPKQIPRKSHQPESFSDQPQINQLKQTPMKQKKAKQILQQPKKSKLNKFRIYAYAVYFTIYVKYFSKRFTQNRKNWFDDRYQSKEGQVIFKKSLNVLQMFHKIDLYKMVQDAKRAKKNQQNDDKLILTNFINLLLDFTEQLMTSQKFIQENHQVFTVGVLNQNFVISNLYTPLETTLLNIHPAGYIRIGQEVQILVLMSKIVIKMLVYNYLLALKFSKKWNIKQQKTYNLDQAQLQYLWDMARKAGTFLTIVCEQIYDAGRNSIQELRHNNWDIAHKKLGISAAKSLQQIDTKSKDQDSQCRMIKYLGGYNALKATITKNSKLRMFKQSLKPRIIDMLTKIYTCLKYQEQKVYQFIYQLTISEEYVIFKGKKKQKQQMKQKGKSKGRKKEIHFKQNENNNTKQYDNAQNTLKSNKISPDYNVSKNILKTSQNLNKQPSSHHNKHNDNNLSINNNSTNLLNPPSISINNISQKWGLDEQSEDQQEPEKNGKKMKYKYEQVFHDKKFNGHDKLLKLKRKKQLLDSKKII